MHDNNCVDNFNCIDNNIVRMYFLCQDSIKKTFKNRKIFRIHAQITNQKNNLCHSKIFRLNLVDDKLLKKVDDSCHSLGFWPASLRKY